MSSTQLLRSEVALWNCTQVELLKEQPCAAGTFYASYKNNTVHSRELHSLLPCQCAHRYHHTSLEKDKGQPCACITALTRTTSLTSIMCLSLTPRLTPTCNLRAVHAVAPLFTPRTAPPPPAEPPKQTNKISLPQTPTLPCHHHHYGE